MGTCDHVTQHKVVENYYWLLNFCMQYVYSPYVAWCIGPMLPGVLALYCLVYWPYIALCIGPMLPCILAQVACCATRFLGLERGSIRTNVLRATCAHLNVA